MKIALRNGGLETLYIILTQPGWCKTPELMFKAGRFLAEVMPPLPAQEFTNAAEARTWREKTGPEFELSDSDAELCRTAAKYCITEGKIGPNLWMKELHEAIGLPKP